MHWHIPYPMATWCVGLMLGCGVGSLGIVGSARADDGAVLQSQSLPTPFGALPYVLPEGYCVMEGRDGRGLSQALDRISPPPPHSLEARFLPCMDRRRTYEDKSWPGDQGAIRVQYYPQEATVPRSGSAGLLVLHQSLMADAQHSPLAMHVFGKILDIPVGAAPMDPQQDAPADGVQTLIHDLRPNLRNDWNAYMHQAMMRTQDPRFVQDGFPIGRDGVAVWWAGIERGAPDHVLAVVRAYTLVHGLLVSFTLDRVFSGPDTYDDMRGDLLPAVLASMQIQEGGSNPVADIAPGSDAAPPPTGTADASPE